MSKRAAENTSSGLELTEAKRRAMADAKKVGMFGATSVDTKKAMMAKLDKSGATLTFMLNGKWTRRGKDAAPDANVVPTLKNTKIIARLVMPSDDELAAANGTYRKYTTEDGEYGVEMDVHCDKDMAELGRKWNEARAKLKDEYRTTLRSTMNDDQVEAHVYEVYGDDVVYEGMVVRYAANRDNWLEVPAERTKKGGALCVDAEKILLAQPMDVFTLANMKHSALVTEYKGETPAAAVAAFEALFTKSSPTHPTPTGRARIYMKAAKLEIKTMADETVVEALRQIDAARPGGDNPYIDRFVPSLFELIDEQQRKELDAELNDDATEAKRAKYYGPLTQRFMSKPTDESVIARPEGMVTRISLGDKFSRGKLGAEAPALDLLVTVRQWRMGEAHKRAVDAAIELAVKRASEEGVEAEDEIEARVADAVREAREWAFFNADTSDGWSYATHLTLYSKTPTEMSKATQLATCPIASPTAWNVLCKALCETNLDLFVTHKIAIADSESHPSNADARERFAAATGAERFGEPLFSFQSNVVRAFIRWDEVVAKACVPLSAAGARALYKKTAKTEEFKALHEAKKVVYALNELPANTIETYFTGVKRVGSATAPRYAFYACLPTTVDDDKMKVLRTLRAAYDAGYEGPLGEVLLEESYTVDDAEIYSAHSALVEARIGRINVSADDVQKAYVLVVDTELLKFLIDAKTVKECMRVMFGMFNE